MGRQRPASTDWMKSAITLAFNPILPATLSGGKATYDYRDEGGQLLFQVVRKTGKRFRQRVPDGRGGWEWKLGDVRRVLYKLPELLADDGDALLQLIDRQVPRLQADAEGLLDFAHEFERPALQRGGVERPQVDPIRRGEQGPAAREVGGVQIQNRGTLAGNLCNASPAADGVPPLLALDAEVRALARQGVHEVTLLGQIVDRYGVDVRDGPDLAALLRIVHEVDGIERIRFITSFPKDMSTDLLQAVRDLPKVMKYLHVPAQSGCNEVLRRMKRGYTVEDYREMMGRINDIIPGCAVSSDFIVGFCGETEEAFQKSLQLIRECRFKNSFIFKYSPRTGTKADEMYPDDVPEDVKRRRNNEMLELQNRISEEDNAEFIGRRVAILVEGPSKSAARRAAREGLPADAAGPLPLLQLPGQVQHHDHQHDQHAGHHHDPERGVLEHAGLAEPTQLQHASAAAEQLTFQLTGRTECDRIVVFDGNPRLIGSLAEIEINDCTSTTLIGSIVTREMQFGSGSILPILV